MAEPKGFVDRLQHVTEELRMIQEELATSELPVLNEQQAETRKEAVQDLKAAVDHMRHTIWGWLESQDSTTESATSIQAIRMQRVTEMLRVLKPSMEPAAAESTPVARSFFEEIQAIAHQTMERHSEPMEERHHKAG